MNSRAAGFIGYRHQLIGIVIGRNPENVFPFAQRSRQGNMAGSLIFRRVNGCKANAKLLACPHYAHGNFTAIGHKHPVRRNIRRFLNDRLRTFQLFFLLILGFVQAKPLFPHDNLTGICCGEILMNDRWLLQEPLEIIGIKAVPPDKNCRYMLKSG